MKLPEEKLKDLIKSGSCSVTTTSSGNAVLALDDEIDKDKILVIFARTNKGLAYSLAPYYNGTNWCCKVINSNSAGISVVANATLAITYYYIEI